MQNDSDHKDRKVSRGPVSEYGEFVSWFDRWIQPIEERKKAKKKEDKDW